MAVSSMQNATLLIETPGTRSSERFYIYSVLLGEFLGLEWRHTLSNRTDTRITLCDHEGEIILPDILLSIPKEQWLTSSSLPEQPLIVWDTIETGLPIPLVDKRLPLIYGDFLSYNLYKTKLRAISPATTHLPIDIFGSAFFMLTRYEEIVKPERDEHDRFPAWASIALQEGFLERPIVDEYVEVLWAVMEGLWPRLKRKSRKFAMSVSHDVDRPSRYGFNPPVKLIRAIAGDILKRRDYGSAILAPWIRATTKSELHSKDPANKFDWIMETSERNNLTSAFYFLCGKTDPSKDGEYDAGHPAIRKLMKKIHDRGHEIGLHPSYGTYKRPDLIAEEAIRLKNICAEENISQPIWGGRMHYLRWKTPDTMRGWDQAGMDYDSTLCFADYAGFRCGTCHEYPAFDVVHGKHFRLKLRPLIAMECTIISNNYMGLGLSQSAVAHFLNLKKVCKKFHGVFSVLWHNSQLALSAERSIYKKLFLL